MSVATRLLRLALEKFSGAWRLNLHVGDVFFSRELFSLGVHNPLVLLYLVRYRLLHLLVIRLILELPMHCQLVNRLRLLCDVLPLLQKSLLLVVSATSFAF